MAAFTGNETSIRVLGLGNDILADDAFGLIVAGEIARRCGPEVEVICSASAGLHLLDDILGATRLVVIDTIVTGQSKPGTIRVFRHDDVEVLAGGSPHSCGLFDAIAKARRLGLPTPADITIVAVEGFDCTTVGGAMHPDVEAAIGAAVDLVLEILKATPSQAGTHG
jgi:hydrogenase maturation protease